MLFRLVAVFEPVRNQHRAVRKSLALGGVNLFEAVNKTSAVGAERHRSARSRRSVGAWGWCDPGRDGRSRWVGRRDAAGRVVREQGVGVEEVRRDTRRARARFPSRTPSGNPPDLACVTFARDITDPNPNPNLQVPGVPSKRAYDLLADEPDTRQGQANSQERYVRVRPPRSRVPLSSPLFDDPTFSFRRVLFPRSRLLLLSSRSTFERVTLLPQPGSTCWCSS